VKLGWTAWTGPCGTADAASSKKGCKGTRGAVYVEFLIAFLPVFCFFLALVQFSLLELINMMLKHTAEQTVRAAIVIIHDDPQYYGGAAMGSVTGQRREDIQKAAEAIIGKSGEVTINMESSYGRDDMVTVEVELNYECTVPFGRLLVCGGGATNATGVYAENDGTKWGKGGKEYRMLRAQASLPNQGADYEY